MPTYILKIAGSDCTPAEEFNRVISVGTESADSISVNVTAAGSPDIGHGYTLAGVPNNADWETGVITVEVNVTTADMNMSLRLSAARINSSCAFQEATSLSAAQVLGTTGVFNFTIPSKDWGAGATGDRIRIVYQFITTAHSGANVVIETGTTDTEIVTVISEGGGPVSRRIFNIS
jgi:hypothetical protein